jgi:hypothetical protein
MGDHELLSRTDNVILSSDLHIFGRTFFTFPTTKIEVLETDHPIALSQ